MFTGLVRYQFARPQSKFAPFAFWFYDQDLTTVGIMPQEMARELARKGFNPGYAHARPNYAWVDGHRDSEHIRVLPHEQWLSDQWFEIMEKQARQAEADGSHVSFADEFGWPSLQANGQLVRNDPTHPDVAEFLLCRDGEVVLQRGIHQEFMVVFDEVKAIKRVYGIYYNRVFEDLLGVELEGKNTLLSRAINPEVLAVVLAVCGEITADVGKDGKVVAVAAEHDERRLIIRVEGP